MKQEPPAGPLFFLRVSSVLWFYYEITVGETIMFPYFLCVFWLLLPFYIFSLGKTDMFIIFDHVWYSLVNHKQQHIFTSHFPYGGLRDVVTLAPSRSRGSRLVPTVQAIQVDALDVQAIGFQMPDVFGTYHGYEKTTLLIWYINHL
jgi:hypothetical protein